MNRMRRSGLSGRRKVSQLEADLSTYTTRADLLELHEILNRYTPEETAEIRRVVRGSVLV